MKTFEFAGYSLAIGDLSQTEPAAGQIEPRDADAATIREHCRHQVVTVFGEQGFVRKRARRHDTGDLALDRSLARRRIADLLANCDRFTFPDEFCQVAFNCVVGHPGHRDRVARRFAA